MTAETSTQQRPWAAVARWPEDNDPAKLKAHFGAMVIAHDRALAALNLDDDEVMRQANERHTRPLIAAYVAGALIETDTFYSTSLDLIRQRVEAGGYPVRLAWEWLTADGINPDEIQAAL